jgi:23S rRNA (adenine2503-C2)-methyltransferase
MQQPDPILKDRKSLIGYTVEQISEALNEFGEPGFRGKQIYQWIHYHNVDSFQEMTNLPNKLRNSLSKYFSLKKLKLVKAHIAVDGTEKYLWKLSDTRHIESVMIPEEKRNTICISSQVGCSLSCNFCATGSMGLLRNLTPGEIVEQVLQIKKLSQHPVTNVVFMGMGEPFLNYPRVIQASQILGDSDGVAIARRKITISTSGIVPKIYQFTDDHIPFGLAISLHAPNQALREQIMPIASKFPLDDLLESVKYYMQAKKRNRVTFEYVLLHGVNDSLIEAKQLISLLSQIRCKINLIPCNQNDLGYISPPLEHLNDFYSSLLQAPFAVTLRKNRGEDIAAACGQLAVKVDEKSIFIKN